MQPCSKRLKALRSFAFAALIPFVLAPSAAEAARITKVKGKQVVIDNEDLEINEGDKLYVMIEGKKKGIVVISKVKSGKSIGKLTKGKAEADAELQLAKSKSSDAAAAEEGSDGESNPDADADADAEKESKTKKKKRRKKSAHRGDSSMLVGFVVGYALDSQSVPNATGQQIAMSGSGYSAKALADMPVSGSIGMIGRVGIEQVNLAGSSYTTSLMYLTADLIGRYSFDMNWAMTPYIGAGFGLHYPLSKSSNILNVPQISSTTVFFLPTIGFNWPMNESMYMVGQFEYGLFPQSNSISTSLMTGRFGLAWNW